MNPMNLDPYTKLIIQRVVNAFETGSAEGDYGAISIHKDGPHDIRQITYGRTQTTEYGKLRTLVRMYVDAKGLFSAELSRYIRHIGSVPLTDDLEFRTLLRKAGRTDPVMIDVQNTFFDAEYFEPAMIWARAHRLDLPLSALVVYDSFIHSGSILPIIRNMFSESPPSGGGDEQRWTRAYVKARDAWLAKHPRAALRKTRYRTRCLAAEIERGNWNLDLLPIRANGVAVS